MAHHEPQYAAPQYSAVAPAVSYSYLPYAAGYKYYYNWGQGGGGRSREFLSMGATAKRKMQRKTIDIRTARGVPIIG